jgi:hypothetical protein
VKLSLISASSIIALLSVGAGSALAGTLSAGPGASNIYDLVHDGVTSSDGGDNTVTKQDPLVSATLALEASTNGIQTMTFTGRLDQALAAGSAYPLVPLGAAAGTKLSDDMVSQAATTGDAQWDVVLKARAVGQERMASLIGNIGNGPLVKDKSSGTVFVAVASPVGFNDGGNPDAGARGSSAYAFAPSSTSTATITVMGAGNLSRQAQNGGLPVVAANSLQRMAPTATDTPQAVVLSDTAQPTLGYTYAPVASPSARLNAVSASFSDVVTASGVRVAEWKGPTTVQTSQNLTGAGKVQMSELRAGQSVSGRVQASQLQAVQGRVQTTEVQAAPEPVQTSEVQAAPTRVQTSEALSNIGKLLDLSQSNPGDNGDTQVDGTRRFLSTSVSVNPTNSVTLYIANVVNATPTSPVGAGTTVEAFLVGPRPDPQTRSVAATKVSEPLQGKILASAGPLNSNLALP